ncbi:MAG: arginine--tRNA ligase [Paludibacteraceae bacterium]|nr:arginine--tRNA ligase [Paludibacteraceae bacterium]
MNIELQISSCVAEAVHQLYGIETTPDKVQIQKTIKDFPGDLTIVTFAFVKAARKAPDAVGLELGNYIKEHVNAVVDFNVVKGFLNLSLSQSQFLDTLNAIAANPDYGFVSADDNAPLVMVEYSSPNTNKPLHLGHVRNNLLGFSLSEILRANGNRVVRTNIVNDRGIHICKSMLAWQKWGNGETPQSSGKKGDHLIGDYYVLFDKEYKKQIQQLISEGQSEDDAKKNAPLIQEAQAMLLKWEQGDAEVRNLWSKMNEWVYEGFDTTYKRMGVAFDKVYYESQTYLVGKKKVEEGLASGVFYRRDDGSVWANLEKDGLDEKLLLRQDGTSVYMTQDIGTATLRFQEYPIDRMIYVVGNEQNYHFQVLSILLDRLGFKWGKSLVHFSYGMVELPNGKMKSREGTVVDADDLMDEMEKTALEMTADRLQDFSDDERKEIARIVGLGALKYFILKVDPKRTMLFNPAESIDFNGNTGAFIQYTYARIQSVLRKASEQGISCPDSLRTDTLTLNEKEQALVQRLSDFRSAVSQAGKELSPSVIANYTYELAKEFNQFYHDCPILKEENTDIMHMRLLLARTTANIIRRALSLLGIEVPARM